MSIRDYNKNIIITSTLNGEIVATIPYDDRIIASEYISEIMHRYINNEEGIMIKVGIKP